MDIRFESLGFSQQEYDRNRENLLRDMASKCVQPMSFEIYRKTPEERQELEDAKASWRMYMRSHGLSKRCGKINHNS